MLLSMDYRSRRLDGCRCLCLLSEGKREQIMRRAFCVALLLSLSSLIGCVSSRPWSRSGEFRQLLQCGMPVETVLQLAATFEELVALPMYWDGLEASGAEPYRTLSLSPGGTSFVLGFQEGNLETVRLTWVSGIMQQSTQMRENLCSGNRAARVKFFNDDPQFFGERFEIDGVSLGLLPETADFRDFWVDAGEHVLRIFDEQGQPIGEMAFPVEDDLSKGSQYVVLEEMRVPGS